MVEEREKSMSVPELWEIHGIRLLRCCWPSEGVALRVCLAMGKILPRNFHGGN